MGPGIHGAGMRWPWGHTVLEILGLFRSRRMRFPLRTMPAEQVESVEAFLKERGVVESGKDMESEANG